MGQSISATPTVHSQQVTGPASAVHVHQALVAATKETTKTRVNLRQWGLPPGTSVPGGNPFFLEIEDWPLSII